MYNNPHFMTFSCLLAQRIPSGRCEGVERTILIDANGCIEHSTVYSMNMRMIQT